jgi:hypothetical protein
MFMAELAPGEKSWEKMLKPGDGHYTWTAIQRHLKIPPRRLYGLCKSLGIEVGPFVRDEPNVKKVYKAKKRWLTEDEVRRIFELYWARRGR